MHDLRLIKVLVPVVFILYLYWRRLPFLMKNLARSVIIGPLPERWNAISREDMTFQERLIIWTVIIILFSLPDWIRLPW